METRITDRPAAPLWPPDQPAALDLDNSPAIALERRAAALIGLAGISGFFSNVWIWTNDPLAIWFGPGLLFGLLVVLPWCRWCRVSPQQTLAAVGLSPIGYAAAVFAYLHGWWFVAGLLGSAISLGSVMASCHPRVREALWMAGLVGWVVGAAMVVPVFPYLGGIAVWQVAVAACLSVALRIEKR